nr:hypothetical protein [Tanacetum cinerariifolium]
MNSVGYKGVVDKVSAFYTKNLAQPWQKMFKVFNRYLTTRTSRHNQTKINILQLFHAVINQKNVDYAALLWLDLMNNVFQKKEAIQDADPEEFPIEEIHATMISRIKEKLDEEEIENMVKGEEDKESYTSEFADSMINDDVDDFGIRIEPESHKKHPEIINDDDEEIEKEKKDKEV